MRHTRLLRQSASSITIALALVAACGAPEAVDNTNNEQSAARAVLDDEPRGPAGGVEGPLLASYHGFSWPAGDRRPGECSQPFEIVYYKPSGPGPFPLYLYTVGTSTEHDLDYITEHYLLPMVARGFVAATVDYENHYLWTAGCTYYDRKASCIYEPRGDSAVSVLGDLPYVDATRIATGGHSQGGHLAILAGNWNANIVAAQPTGVTPTRQCLLELALPVDRIRLGNGEHEDRHGCGIPYWGCWTSSRRCNRRRSEQLTQLSCGAGATECLRENGSGWFLALDEQAGLPCADHGYWRLPTFDGARPQWIASKDSWGKDANLDWLEQMVATLDH